MSSTSWRRRFPRETVLMDNVRTHKVAGVKEAIEAKGARLVYLPPYSPDFNPIEKPFSKIKSILERIARARRRAERVASAAEFTPQRHELLASLQYLACFPIREAASSPHARRRSGVDKTNNPKGFRTFGCAKLRPAEAMACGGFQNDRSALDRPRDSGSHLSTRTRTSCGSSS